MKVNFNADFKDFNGEPLLVDGNPQVIGHIVAQCLFNGTGIRPSGNMQTDNGKKMRAYHLCMRIMDTGGEIEITSEDAVLNKEAVSALYPGLLLAGCTTDRKIRRIIYGH